MKIFILVVAIALAVVASGCTGADSMATVKKGDTVAVNYVGTLEDGTMFDTSLAEQAKKGNVYNEQRGYEPLEFSVGAGQMIKGFDTGVVGMTIGETKKVTIPAAEAYGEFRTELVREVQTNLITGNTNTTLKAGDKLYVQSPQGVQEVKVVSSNANVTRVDFNHPLAGKTLIFEITVVAIK